MLIHGIDFPNEILKAINEDRLVVFAGAGVSKSKPSNLPDFKGLAQEVGHLCGEEYNDETQIDEFLGDLERKGVKVKEYVSEVLSPKEAKPNSFHKNILKLFRNDDAIRIVTTNQDELFEKAMRGLRIKGVREYSAPALPYGNDFTGLIHLHGKISEPKHIVVTDTDFGNAYMLNGYATSFLISLFREYVVLFVGYSYNDPIVRYLTTAITAKNISNAFILTEKITPQQNRTRFQGIPHGDATHQIACDALGVIGEYTKRGIFDWQQRIKALNFDSPPIDSETSDELLDGIRNLSIQKHFCSEIKGEGWPEWLDEQGVFDSLFCERAELSEQDSIWGYWLACNYFDNKLLSLIERHKGEINEHFCDIILGQFQSSDERFTNDLFCLYVSILLDKVSGEYELYNLIRISNDRGLTDIKWSVFWKMIGFQIGLEKPFLYLEENATYRAKHIWNASSDLIRMVWEKELLGQIVNARSVFFKCVRIIEGLYDRLNHWSYRNNSFSLDYLDIENNEKTRCFRDAELIICEILENAFQEINTSNPLLASSLALDLLSSDCALLRRIALLLIRRYALISAEEKTDAVLESFSLHEHAEREQIFKLIAESFDAVSEKKQKQIIDKIWDVSVESKNLESDAEKDRHINYLRYNWLKWLESKSKHTKEISKKISLIRKKYPDFMPRERPDLAIEPVTTRWGSESPISEKDLIALSAQDASSFIIDYKEDRSVMGPDRFGLMQTTMAACQSDVSWAVDLLKSLKVRGDWSVDLWDSVFRGLSKGITKKREFTKVIECFDDELITNCGLPIAHFIYDSISQETISEEITDNLIKRITRLVKKLWLHREVSKAVKSSIIDASFNNSTGILTHILMHLMCLKPEERAIPLWLKTIIEKQIEKSESLSEYICVLCGYSAHLFYRNPKWTKEHVFKYLEDKDANNKKAAWEGFLALVSNFSIEFGSAVISLFSKNIEIITELESDYRARFVHDYALLMVYMTDDPTSKHISKLFKVTDSSDRVRFAYSIALFLGKMKSDERSNLWNRWLRKYWGNRNNNIPIAINKDEYNEMLLWLIGLPEYEEGVEYALATNMKNTTPNKFFSGILEADELRRYPEKTAQLVVHLIKNADGRQIYSNINELVNSLKSKTSSTTRKELDDLFM